MNTWLEDLLALIGVSTPDKKDLLRGMDKATRSLEFDHFSLAYQSVLPVTQPRLSWLTNYPKAWQEHYFQAGYLRIDPRIGRARACRKAFVWTPELFQHVPALWNDLQKNDLENGCTQPILSEASGVSMLSFVRKERAVTAAELAEKEKDILQLAQIVHKLYARLLRQQEASTLPELTRREMEIMLWSAEGKSAQDIAHRLGISRNTIEFHIKNALAKLNAPNKTAAVVRAASLGMLH